MKDIDERCRRCKGRYGNQDIGRQLGALNHLIRRRIEKENSSELMKISAANGYILFYLHENKSKDIFQKDLEDAFDITRSTASKVLSLMEEKGLVMRGAVAGDARLKKITITEKGEEVVSTLVHNRKMMEESLTEGFTEEELKQLYAYLKRMKDNMKR